MTIGREMSKMKLPGRLERACTCQIWAQHPPHPYTTQQAPIQLNLAEGVYTRMRWAMGQLRRWELSHRQRHLLGFQGSRGSRILKKVITNQYPIVPFIYPDSLTCVLGGTVRTHRRVLHCPVACAGERSRGARAPG